MSQIKFIDYSEEVKAAIAELAAIALEEAAGELESQTKRNTAVDTGKTKNSWRHKTAKNDDGYISHVGSDYENSIWEEFGTGDYALHGNGRKGGWFYVDAKGDGHFTHGKRPRRPFWNAYTSLKSKLIQRIQSVFKGGLS